MILGKSPRNWLERLTKIRQPGALRALRFSDHPSPKLAGPSVLPVTHRRYPCWNSAIPEQTAAIAETNAAAAFNRLALLRALRTGSKTSLPVEPHIWKCWNSHKGCEEPQPRGDQRCNASDVDHGPQPSGCPGI